MTLDSLDRQLLERIQRAFPVEPRPFRALADQVGSTEADVLTRVQRLQDQGIIRQIGPVFDLKRLDHISTLCAAKVAPGEVEAVAAVINQFTEVTHNYLREHAYNLWFTVIAPSGERIEAILQTIRGATGVEDVVSLPAERTFKIDVRFDTTGGGP